MAVLIEKLDENSQTKTGMRHGDWPDWKYLLARGANETAYMRADQNGGRVDPVLSPMQMWRKQWDLHVSRVAHDDIIDQISGRKVLPRRNITGIRETDIDLKREAAARHRALIAKQRTERMVNPHVS